MINRYRICFLAFLMISATACSTINVRHVDNRGEPPKNDGLYYSLPKTAVTMEVTVNKISRIKGPYAAYADKYLGLSNIITENSISFSLDNIKMDSYSIPDPEQYYFVEIPKGCRKKNPVLLQLSEAGLVNGINNNDEIKSSISAATSSVEISEDLNEPSAQFSVNSNLAESFDTIIEKVNLDTITIEKKVLKKILIEKTNEQKAKEAADFIMRVKEGKFNLITGFSEVNYSKESMEYMSVQLDKMETEYLNLFTGITVKRQLKYYFTFVPSYTENSIYMPVFRFSAKDGIIDTSGYKGDNVYIKIDRFDNTKPLSAFDNAKQNPKKKTHGFYYRIPDYAMVSVIYNDKVKADANILINQFGVVAELPAKKSLKILFYPNSGAVKSVEIK